MSVLTTIMPETEWPKKRLIEGLPLEIRFQIYSPRSCRGILSHGVSKGERRSSPLLLPHGVIPLGGEIKLIIGGNAVGKIG